jgi:hypothetical protein
MADDLSLVLRWPTGASVAVRASPMSTPAAIIPAACGAHSILVRDGFVLDGRRSLVSQGIRSGDTLAVLDRGLIVRPGAKTTPFESKTQSILCEVLRIKDSHYRPLETSRDAELLCKQVLDEAEVDPWDGFVPPPDKTVIARPAIGATPLPQFTEEESSDEDECLDEPRRLRFASMKEAGKFFSKNPWGGWAW